MLAYLLCNYIIELLYLYFMLLNYVQFYCNYFILFQLCAQILTIALSTACRLPPVYLCGEFLAD